MPTTKIEDVALKAGVSAATVDRVIHGRGNPRQTTVLKVKQAINELGYRPNLAASALARGQMRRIGIVIPKLEIGFLRDLASQVESLRDEMEISGASLHILQCDEVDPVSFANRFEEFAGDMDACGILGPNDPAIVEAVARLERKGTPIAAIVSELSTSIRSLFVGPNNRDLGATAASLLAPTMASEDGCAVIFKPAALQEDHEARFLGFCSALVNAGIEQERIKTFIAPVEQSEQELAAHAVEQLASVQISCAYMTGGGLGAQMSALQACQKTQVTTVATDLTDFSRGLLLSNKLNFVVACDVKEIIRTASASLLRKLSEPLWDPKVGFQQVQVFTRFNLPQSN